MSDSQCFLSGKSDCKLTDVNINGIIYWVDEDIADEHPFKKLKEMIADKVQETENKKDEAINQIKAAAASLGISKEALGRLLLGQKEDQDTIAEVTESIPVKSAPVVAKIKPTANDDFVEVDGDLPTAVKGVRANIDSSASDLPGSMPAHRSFSDKDGNLVREEGKKIKRLEDGIVEVSNMGTTVIRMDHQSGSVIDKMLRTVDENGNLTRAAICGHGRTSGGRTIDCNLCQGSGITRIGYKKCPKCDGIGTTNV